MADFKGFSPLGPGELLALTGQIHSEDYKYDKIFALYCGTKNDMTPADYGRASTSITCVAVAGLNMEEKRVVDITVHPYFRKLGFGKTLVNLLVKEFGIEQAYVVSEDAEKFWKAIGWVYIGSKLDKDDVVQIWVTPERAEMKMDEFREQWESLSETRKRLEEDKLR